MSSAIKEELERFRSEKRFKKSAQNKAVTNAKLQAMKVIELFYNFRFNTRLNRFISEFKTRKSSENDEMKIFYESQEDEASFGSNLNARKIATKYLHEVFKETEYFDSTFIEILQDLLRYQEETIVSQALVLLNSNFSAHENLFKKCIETQLLITQKSLDAFDKINDHLPKLKMLKNSKWNDEIADTMIFILKLFIRLCTLETDVREGHLLNQEMLYNYGILADIFDIFQHFAVDGKPRMEKYSRSDVELLRYAFRLLKAMSRNNPAVKQQLCSNMEYLLTIHGAEAEMGESLAEVFKGNATNCLKVSPAHIKSIVHMYAESYHPVWVSLLCCLAVVDGFPIKRNQGLVVKALMSYQQSLALITETTTSERIEILKGLDNDDKGTFVQKHQLCSLVYLFSVCSTGENKSVESICQCLLTMDELLTVINMKELCAGLRLPFVAFLTNGYLHSYSASVRDEIGKYKTDDRIKLFLNSCCDMLNKAIEIVEVDNATSFEMLRQRPANLHRNLADTLHEQKEILHYIFDGLLPCIYTIFEKHWRSTIFIDVTLVANILYISRFGNCVGPIISRSYQRIWLQNTLRLISHTSNSPINIPVLQMDTNKKSDGGIQYALYYKEELLLNSQFDNFAMNLRAAYEGKNTVRQQLGVPLDRVYISSELTDPLPLGEEFQKLVTCFKVEEKKFPGKHYNIEGLVTHLKHSLTAAPALTEHDRMELELLDIKCFQILQAMIHNVLIQLPPNKHGSPSLYSKIMKSLHECQGSLDKQGLVQVALKHLGRTREQIVRVCFNLLNILYKSNKKTPETFVQLNSELHEEAFFVAVQSRLISTASLIKEQRFMYGLQQKAVQSSESLIKAMKTRAKSAFMQNPDAISVSQSSAAILRLGLEKGLGGLEHMKNLFINKVAPDEQQLELQAIEDSTAQMINKPHETTYDEIVLNDAGLPLIDAKAADYTDITWPSKTSAEKVSHIGREKEEINDLLDFECPDLTAYHDVADVRVVLRTLRSLCDLEYSKAQNLMREQPLNVKSVNLVAEVCHFLSLLYTNIDSDHAELVSEILETLTEFVQGNHANQAVVFDMKVVDYLNHILRSDVYPLCTTEDVLRLRATIGTLVRFLTEENQAEKNKTSQSKIILAAVNKEGLWVTLQDCYHKTVDNVLTEDEKFESLNIAFLYYTILRHAVDLGLTNEDAYSDYPAWKFLTARTMGIEFVKGGVLQRLYFRVTDQKSLRPEVEEKMKWEVDRSSHGNKMRDFMAWIEDIHDDILFQRRIHSHFLGRFFVRQWKFFNYAVLLLTLILNVIMLVVWKENIHRENSYEDFWLYHPPKYDSIWRALGSCHNVISFCLVISYFLSNAAGFASSKQTTMRQINKLNRLVRLNASVDPKERPSKLEVSIFGFQTVYYVLFFGFSMSGTVVSPSFFAFHLLQIVQNNQLLTRVIRAVTVNGRSLLWVALMGVIIMYMYGLIGFLTLRSVYRQNLHFCESLWECTLTTMREGLIYRLMRIDYPVRVATVDTNTTAAVNNNFDVYTFKLLFDLSFFILVLTIGLNVIFGIIVDTFRQLRDAKWRIEQDMQTRCFICGRSSYEFEQRGINFRYHCTVEHNMISYVFFFVRLEDMPTDELSHLEMYLMKMAKKEDYNFFPFNRALSLDETEMEDSAVEREWVIMKQLDNIVQKLDAEENQRAKMELKKRQLEWESMYKVKSPRSLETQQTHAESAVSGTSPGSSATSGGTLAPSESKLGESFAKLRTKKAFKPMTYVGKYH